MIAQDSTTIPNSQLKRALYLVEQGRICKIELEYTKEINKTLENLIIIKDSLLYSSNKIINYQDQIIKTYQSDSTSFRTSLNIQENINKTLKKELKQEKIKTKIIAISAIIILIISVI